MGSDAPVGAAVSGEGTASVPEADPWLALDEPDASPTHVDSLARERLGRFAVDDVRRSAGLTSWLVRRAAADGSTGLDGGTWVAALRGYGIESARPGLDAAAAAGRVVALPEERAIAHPEWGPLEERIADDLHAVLASSELDEVPSDPVEVAAAMPLCAVVVGGGHAPEQWIASVRERAEAAGRGLTLVEEAHRLDLAAADRLLDEHDIDANLVLVGDPDQLEPVAPGRVFGDLVASGVVPVVRLGLADGAGRVDGAGPVGTGGPVETVGPVGTTAHTGTAGPVGSAGHVGTAGPIARLVESLRDGELPTIEPDQHDVVVLPLADAAEAVARVVELVTETLPRVTGVGPSDVLTLGIRSAGTAGVDALREAVGSAGCEAVAVHEALGRRAEAVVVVLPAESAGSLTRAHLISAASTARRQLTIVHQAGPALAAAVRSRPHRPRRTRLARLLQA